MNQNSGILSAFESVLASVYLPAIKAYSRWGELEESPQGRKTKKHFIDNFDNFVMYLRSKFSFTNYTNFLNNYIFHF